MTRWKRLRWVNVLPGDANGVRNQHWEAVDGECRWTAVFQGVTRAGLVVWSLRRWSSAGREVFEPYRTLRACQSAAEGMRVRADMARQKP